MFVVSLFSVWLFAGVDLETSFFWSVCSTVTPGCYMGEKFPYESIVVRLFTIFNAVSYLVIVSFLVAKFVDLISGINLGGKKMQKKIESLENHFIVCGYGGLGQAICETLREHGQDLVIVEINKKTAEHLEAEGFLCVEGDALDSRVLEKAGITRSKRVFSALGSDSGNVFLTLTAKELNSSVRVATRAYTEDAKRKLHRAGADIIVMPEIIGGYEIAKDALELEKSMSHKLVSRKEGEE
jgi:voltage-gated potassium channel